MTRRNLLSLIAVAPLAAAQTPPPAAPPPTGDTSLDIFQAAFKGDIPRATHLVADNPAIAQLRSADGRTALHYAAAGGHADMIFFLTQKGADLSAGPESPLLAAVDFPEPRAAFDCASALLINNSNPNAKRADGKSALDLARARGYADVVELIIHRAKDVHFAQRQTFDAEGRPFVAENIDGLPQDFINEFARLAHFDVERVKHLLKLAPGLIAARATWDESAIEAAAHMGLTPLARHLADHGAPVSTCTATVLGLAPRVAALLKLDPDCVRERGAHDIALLAYTAEGEPRVEIAEMLLRAGVGVHETAFAGMTTLHMAAGKGYIELAETLLAHGADVNRPAARRDPPVTPLATAIARKQEKMADFLKSRGGHA